MTTTPTMIETLEATGTLLIGSRAHLLRPDLSNRTVCGRYDFNKVSDQRLAAISSPKPPCGMCYDPGAATARAARHPATAAR